MTSLISARPLVWTSWIRPLLGGTPRRFVDGGLEPTWSPDGTRLIYHTNDLGDPLFVADQDGGNPRRIFKVPVDGGPPIQLTTTLSVNPVWSPDGRLILYSEQQQAGQFEVKGITPDRTPIPIVSPQIVGFGTGTRYRFLPDEDALIVLEGAVGASRNFFKVDLATGERRQLTDLDGHSVIQNFVSPDGTRIVFDRWRQHADIAMLTLAP